jgi:hypothetical protein
MSAQWKNPPIAKVYEALSAALDGRVEQTGAGESIVTSSGRDKTYKVRWTEDLAAFTSNDNASKFQGYIGYPIIAVLLHLGKLPYDPGTAAPLKGIPWKELNDRFKRDYEKAIDHALVQLAPNERADLQQMVEDIYSRLIALGLERRS